MGDRLSEAAILVVVGMAVVFAALVILMVSIMIVSRLAPERAKKAEAQSPASGNEMTDKEKIAAIAVAIARLMEQDETPAEKCGINASRYCNDTGRWLAFGREQTMHSRRKAGRQWGRRSD